MKVVYIITKSEVGGAQTHVLDLLKEGYKVFESVSVISSPGGWLQDKCSDLNINFYPNKYFKNSFNPFNLVKSLFLVRRVVRSINPDIVHCHSGGGGFYGRLGTIGLPVKRIFTVHGWSFRPKTPFFQKIVSWIAEFLMKFLTHKTICVSFYDQNIGIKYGIINKKNSLTIHNGVLLPDFSPKKESSKINILFAGRLAPPKRQDIFLESIALLSEDIKNRINVTILGSGVNRNNLEQLLENLNIKNIVSIESEIDTNLMGEKYKSSDILVLISDYEALPMVILEAMSFGLPVIASNVGGIREVINPSVGVLVHKNTKEEFALKIEYLVLNKEERDGLGLSSRKLITEKFTLEKMINETSGVYKSLVSENNLNSFEDNTKI